MVTTLRPGRGGFIRPFGCAWFIREFLAGHAPEDSPTIDPDTGAPQTDINYQYKSALVRAIARDRAERLEEARIRKGFPAFTEEEAAKAYEAELKKVPYKYTRMRYHSFLVYFGMLKRLGWVEETGESEASALQDNYPPGPSRIFYRLTKAGEAAADAEWSNPLFVLYPETFLRHHPGHTTP
ncbi:hypothetical protein ES706_05167 [subsurface metagenome]